MIKKLINNYKKLNGLEIIAIFFLGFALGQVTPYLDYLIFDNTIAPLMLGSLRAMIILIVVGFGLCINYMKNYEK